MNPTVYLETTIISYLVARPSRDIVLMAQQQVTADWWMKRDRFDLFISQLVISEASAGDPAAAANRLATLDGIPLLPPSESAHLLASALIAEFAIPKQAQRDASHVAIAAVNGIDFLLTWN